MILLLTACTQLPQVKFLNETDETLRMTSGDLEFILEPGSLTEPFNLAGLFKYPVQIKTETCEASYGADFPNSIADSKNSNDFESEFLGNYNKFDARVVINPDMSLHLFASRKSTEQFQEISAFGFPAQPEKTHCADDN